MPDSVGPRRTRSARFLALTLTLLVVVGVGAWATWTAVHQDSNPEIADGAASPGASATSTPQPLELQPALHELEAPGAVTAQTDAAAANELATALFETAPVVIIIDDSTEVSNELAGAVKTLAAPLLVATQGFDVAATVEKLHARAVLNATDTSRGTEIELPDEAAEIEFSTDWHQDLRDELGPIIEPHSTENPGAAAYFQGAEGEYPLASLTAASAGYNSYYLENADLLAAAPDLTETEQLVLVGPDLPEAKTLNWQYAVLNQENTLPGGGYELLAGKRYVALYGSPGVPALGVLGQNKLEKSIDVAQDYAEKYEKLTDDTVIPTFEIIATVASASAGTDGKYSNRLSVEKLRPWIESAGEAGYYVLLDLQPGRTHFLNQAKEYEELLKLPHVGLALDPEWRLKKDQRHLQQIGSVSAKEINEVSQWLAEMVRENDLPPKMLVLHQFSLVMIKDRADVQVDHPELSIIIHADGQGTQSAKQGTWTALHKNAPPVAGWGWKNFLKEDHPVLNPKQTYKIDPVPDLVTYQ